MIALIVFISLTNLEMCANNTIVYYSFYRLNQIQIQIMGDFNVDLLKCNDNNSAGDFFNMFSSYFFSPFVLQPTRLRSKTLIDNIFSAYLRSDTSILTTENI